MSDREYRILIAKDIDSIYALAGTKWTVLENTIREFHTLDSHDDQLFGDIGGVNVNAHGIVALAWK